MLENDCLKLTIKLLVLQIYLYIRNYISTLVSKVRIESLRKEIFHVIAHRKIHLQLILTRLLNNVNTTHVVTIKTGTYGTERNLKVAFTIFTKLNVQSQTRCIHTPRPITYLVRGRWMKLKREWRNARCAFVKQRIG